MQAAAAASRVSAEVAAMILSWGLPAAQADMVLTVLADHLLTTLHRLMKADPQQVVALDGMQHLVYGARLLVLEKLEDLKVSSPPATPSVYPASSRPRPQCAPSCRLLSLYVNIYIYIYIYIYNTYIYTYIYVHTYICIHNIYSCIMHMYIYTHT